MSRSRFLRVANAAGWAVAGLLLATAPPSPATALPPAMPEPVAASLESIVRDWRQLYARTPQALKLANPTDPLRDFLKRTDATMSAVDQAMEALAAADATVPPGRDEALTGVEAQLVARQEEIIRLQLDLVAIEEPHQYVPTLGLPDDMTIGDLPPEIASVAWLVRDPRTAGTWSTLLRLEQTGDEEREQALALARELEEARRERSIVVHVNRGDELAAARTRSDQRLAAALQAIGDAGARAESGDVAAAGTPTPTPRPFPDTSRLRNHLHLTRESLKSALYQLAQTRAPQP